MIALIGTGAVRARPAGCDPMRLLLKNLLFTLVVPGTVGVYLPLLIARQRSAAAGPTLALAALLIAVGGAVYAWCVWDFATFGRGTPAPIDAPKQLVVRGLYRHVRNPMYVGVLAVIFGWALLFRALGVLIYGLAAIGWMHLFVVYYEEPHLKRIFGDPYDRYRARVGRWLPRLRARGAA
jgi:protein-S-isoprenylcysteine O-methyltransferase Ste14